jgi:hypothetical protein
MIEKSHSQIEHSISERYYFSKKAANMVCVTSREGLTYRKGIGVKLQILYKCSQHYMTSDSVFSLGV